MEKGTHPVGIVGSRARLASVDWAAMRRAFVERPDRPTYEELTREFGCTLDRVRKAASDEGWPTLRAQFLDQQLVQGDAAIALLKAAKVDTLVVNRFSSTALEVLTQLDHVVQTINQKGAAASRASVLNTVTFALNNLASAMHRVGCVGLPKALKDQADLGNGRWNPQMLSALNVTVQNIVGAAANLPQEPAGAPTAAISATPSPDATQVPPPALAEPSGGTIEMVADEERDAVADAVL